MEPTNSLTQFYNDLKAGKPDISPEQPTVTHFIGAPNSPGTMAWRNKALHHCNGLKDKCCKHILLDIYCKILPFDKDYIDNNQGQMRGDIDNFLAKKGMNATQYLTSCYEATKAPLLEFILRSTDNIGREYMKEADEVLKDSQGEEIQEPREPETTDDDVEGQLVDVKEDPEYENFIDKLKQKTIQKIVDDVSALIDKSKEENDMTFDTKPDQDAVAQESAVGVGVDYLQKKLWKSNIEFTEEQREEMIGMAIREATLRQLDVVFKQPGNTFREFVSTIFYGKGVIINESALETFME